MYRGIVGESDTTSQGVVGDDNAVMSQELSSKLRQKYQECKDRKVGCMGIPDGCVEMFLEDSKTVCTVMLSWSSSDGIRNSYLLTGTSGNPNRGYVAMAFSDDQDMVRITNEFTGISVRD